MITIRKEKLFHNSMVNDEVVEKMAHFEDLESSNSEVHQLKNELHTLLRCEENMEMVSLDLSMFMAKYYGKFYDPKLPFELESRAILSHCLMYYRACFVFGSKNKMPFWFLDNELLKTEIHQKVRLLGDRLVGHLDNDSLARQDMIHWKFKVVHDELEPYEPILLFSKVLSLHRLEIIEWQDHIQFLLKELRSKIQALTLEINQKIRIIR